MNNFHYCNLEKFKGILNSNTVWLTPVQTMNDSEEVIHLYKRVWEQTRTILLKEYAIDDWAKQIIDIVDHKVRTIDIYIDMPYCSCFSDDGDLLQQWRLYADDGKGFSIGFNFNMLGISDDLPFPNSILKESMGFGNVIYKFNEQLEILLSVINQILSERTYTAIDWLRIIKNLRCYSPVFKNHTFYSEQERRLIYYYQDHDLNDSIISGPHEYRDNIQRFDFKWYKSKSEHCIDSIILGPKNSLSVDETLAMLQECGIYISKDKIIRSSSTYR